MAEQLVPDELWQAIEPLLPPKRQQRRGGRPWIDDRAVLGGSVSLLRTGVPWRLLPARELGGGSPVTCWRRLRTWQRAGVWAALHARLLDWLGEDGSIDWSRASVDSVAVRAALASAVPPPRKTPMRWSPKLEPAKPLIDAMLREDVTAPRKHSTPLGGCWPV